MTRQAQAPGLDWVVTATEAEMIAYLGPEVPCPRCGATLRRDPLWSTPHMADDLGHSFSNVRALVVELYQRGTLSSLGRSRTATRLRDGHAA